MKINNLKNFINTGTSWQHYKCSSYAPVNLYTAIKQGFDDILDYYVKAHGFRVITLNFFDTYGPGDTRNKIFNLLINSGDKNEDLFVTSGEQVIDLVYINDVVNAYLAATYYFDIDFNFHLKYGLSSGERILLRDLKNKITTKLNLKTNISFGENKYCDREVFFLWNPPRGLPNWAPTPGALDNYLKLINE
jgi:nucleoside-diphosphate-sugar epimerase